jgi:stage III sporulation protein SpoIIIAA
MIGCSGCSGEWAVVLVKSCDDAVLRERIFDSKKIGFGESTLISQLCRATEMDITMIGLQNAGKTSLLRVLAVSFASSARCYRWNLN